MVGASRGGPFEGTSLVVGVAKVFMGDRHLDFAVGRTQDVGEALPLNGDASEREVVLGECTSLHAPAAAAGILHHKPACLSHASWNQISLADHVTLQLRLVVWDDGVIHISVEGHVTLQLSPIGGTMACFESGQIMALARSPTLAYPSPWHFSASNIALH